MDPVGRFLQAVFPLGKRTAVLQPGSTVRAEVLQSMGNNRWLLQVGSQRLSAQSHLSLSPHQMLNVRIEQGSSGLIFRVLEESAASDRLTQILHTHGIIENQAEFRAVLESFVHIGIPLSEAYTLPALEQFGRLFRDFPRIRGRFREAARLIAMFSDRGFRVPDDMILALLGFGEDSSERENHHSPHHNHAQQESFSHDAPSQDTSSQDSPGQDESGNNGNQPVLLLPGSESAPDIPLSLLNSTCNRENPWIVTPFIYTLEGSGTRLEGTLRLQMVSGHAAVVVLDVPTGQGRWVFNWFPGSEAPLRVYSDHPAESSKILSTLAELLEDTPLSPPKSIEMIENWNGFEDAGHTPEVVHVDAHG